MEYPTLNDELIEAYKSNPRLKKVGQTISWTPETSKEYARCKADPIYFIENYVTVYTLDFGPQPFKLYPFQKKMVKRLLKQRNVIMRSARQSGKTQTVGAFILWYTLFNEQKTAAILANKQDTAIEIISRIQDMYQSLPLWLQQGIVDWSKMSYRLENKSRVISSSTADNAIRGFSINLLYLDEFAHVDNNIAEAFFTSVWPTLSSGTTTKLIMSSTPKGMNMFYKLFTEAENGTNGFYPITAKWYDVPGRNQKWADAQKKVLGEEKFLQEMEVEFMGSAGTLISSKTLRNLVFLKPIKNMFEEKFQMYVEPEKNHRYVICADCSHGKELDASAFTVIDVTTMPYKVVGKYRYDNIPAELYPGVIAQAAKYYNEAYVLVENNDIGALVLRILLEDYEYENIFYTDSHLKYKDSTVTTKLKTPGLRTTTRTKRQGCNALKFLVENEQLIITDFDIIQELTTFVVKPNKTYAADAGTDMHDDLVMSLVLFAWLTTQQFFKDLANSDARRKLYDDRQKEIENEMPVPPVFVSPTTIPNTFLSGGVVWSEAKDEESIGQMWVNW